MRSDATHHNRCATRVPRGFTLIEVLVVVAIIALLTAILIPSLVKAREQARVVKCMSNMQNLPKAVLTFSVDHRGYAQLVGEPPEWKKLDPSMTRYDYQTGAHGQPGLWLKPWPIAYARQLGLVSLKRMENYFTSAYNNDPGFYFKQFGRQEIFVCPSDKILVHNAWSPNTNLFGVYGPLSYAANEDVFGATGVNPGQSTDYFSEGQPWRDGAARDDPIPRAKRLEGKLEDIIRPSQVALFSDGGNEDHPTSPALLITNNPDIHGPYLENYERAFLRLPHFRHNDKGGLAVALADGSGTYVNPLEWIPISGKRYVKRYTPRIRISPYEVGKLNPIQP